MNLGKIVKPLSIIFVLVTILLTTGCSKQKRDRHNQIINNFNTRPAEFSQTQDNVTIETKKLSLNEFNTIFPGPNFKKKKFYKKYKIAQINIKNNNIQDINVNISDKNINKSDLNNVGINIDKIELVTEFILIPTVVVSTFYTIATLAVFAVIVPQLYHPTNGHPIVGSVWSGAIIILPIVAGLYALHKLNKYFTKLKNRKIEKSNNSVIKFFNENVLSESEITIPTRTSVKRYIIFDKINFMGKKYPNNSINFTIPLN